MDVDPAASLRCWEIELELGGRDYTIPALPAADWFPILLSGDPQEVLDLLPSSSDIDDQLLSGQVDPADLVTALRDAAEEAAGRSFHAAVVLAIVAQSQWSAVNGRLVLAGFRWDVSPLGAALDAIYTIMSEALDEKGRTRFLALLENESMTDPARKGKASTRIASEFESMAGPKPTGGLIATGEPSEGQRPKTQPRPQTPRQGGRSTVPRQPRAPRARNDPAASSGSPPGEA